MLVLERKESETLVFLLPSGETVNVTLSEVESKRAKIVINAPQDVKVFREELLQPMRK